MIDVCRSFGISRKINYKIYDPFLQVRQSCCCVWHRGFRHHANGVVSVVRRHARNLALACCDSLFLLVDSGFFVANTLRIVDGGYVPPLLAALVYGVMMIWHRGTLAVARRLRWA
jgi:hypothetical protein